MSTRTVNLRMPSLEEVARRCIESQRAITRIHWALDDARRDQDADQVVFEDTEVRNWIEALRGAAVALAFASMLEEVSPATTAENLSPERKTHR